MAVSVCCLLPFSILHFKVVKPQRLVKKDIDAGKPTHVNNIVPNQESDGATVVSQKILDTYTNNYTQSDTSQHRSEYMQYLLLVLTLFLIMQFS